jgi:hypothetical protein
MGRALYSFWFLGGFLKMSIAIPIYGAPTGQEPLTRNGGVDGVRAAPSICLSVLF